MKKLFLIRHGSTEQNDERRYCGVTDIPLSIDGLEQARLAADRLSSENLSTIFSSPLVRSSQTAEKIAKPHQLKIKCIPGLREIDFGKWEGLTFDEICSKYPEEKNNWFESPRDLVFPDGESVIDLQCRATESIEDISNCPDNVAIVAHGGSLRVIICHLCGWPIEMLHSFELDTGSITILEHYGQTAMVKVLNDTCHLEVRK